jgi:hypothetical protein
MSSALAIIGLTYGANDIQVLDGLYLEIVGGLDDSPTVRGEDVTVPYADGQTTRPRRFHERRILLAGHVTGTGATTALAQGDYRGNVKAMLALFDAAAAAADLVASLEDGTTATVAARTLSVVTVPVAPSEWSSVSIELLAVEDWAIT